jgi:TonB-dependent SusC/RagA subfamily outer membrane receptor
MRRSSLVVLALAASLVAACHSEKLAGPAAQDAVRRAQSLDLSRFGHPLILVDGKEVTDSAARTLDAQSIENVEVLKGPAAATQYGERAAAGIILITTKTGKAAPSR